MLLIGIDLGTSAVKLLLMEERGRIINTVTEEYPLSFPHPGWAEQKPEDWIRALKKGIRRLTDGMKKEEISVVSVAGQMHGLVALDQRDLPIRPAILWNDGRTALETEYLNTVTGEERIRELSGNIAFSGFTAPKLLWMYRNEPKLFEKINKILLPKDYINFYLTGNYSTDYSDASGTLLLDVKNRDWSEALLNICRVSREQLPVLYESYQCIGTIRKELSEELGLPYGVKVVAGAADNAAAAIGTGTVGDGSCNISLGTSGTVFVSSCDYPGVARSGLHVFCHADGSYHILGCMLSAASCNKWWMENILGSSDYTGEQNKISERELGQSGLYFLPYLMGERAPHNDPLARAAFIGLSMNTSRESMMEAVLEGVAFGLRDSMEAIKKMGISVSESTVCGGGARSMLWKRIIASTLDIELKGIETEQGPGYGAAMLAAVGAGIYPDIKTCVKELVRPVERICPEPMLVSRYAAKYQSFIKLYPALKDFFKSQI